MNNNVKRATHVVNVLFRHGLSYFVHELGLKWHLPFLQKLAPRGRPPSDLPARLRKAMEDLGGAYLKLGQFLALRPDLLPAAYCDEFKKLLDEVPPMPFGQVKAVIERNLKAPLSAFFSHVDAAPIGSASIAQVHRARLKNGKDVVIKVQRPEAREQFAADIDILYYLAHKIEKRFVSGAPLSAGTQLRGLKNFRAFSPTTIVKEFERYTAQELNFVLEARTIDRFARHFRNSRTVVIPGVHWPATTNQVLTMDCLDGVKLTDVLRNPKRYPCTLLAHRIADAAFEQILRLGVFHADLHPGNILVLPGNKIGLLDFGIVGNLNEALITQAITLYSALIEKNTAAITSTLLNAGVPASNADIDDLALDVERIVNEWYGTELGQTRVTQMLQALLESAIAHRIMMPVSFILLGKALVTMEGTCLALDPEFNFVAYSQPKIAELLREQRQPKMALRKFAKFSKQYAEMLSGLPMQASDALARIKRGAIDLTLKETDIKHLGMDLNQSSNRLSYSLIIASLLVASALLVDVPPKFGSYSVFTVAGIAFAACLLIILLKSVWQEGIEPFDPHKEL